MRTQAQRQVAKKFSETLRKDAKRNVEYVRLLPKPTAEQAERDSRNRMVNAALRHDAGRQTITEDDGEK